MVTLLGASCPLEGAFFPSFYGVKSEWVFLCFSEENILMIWWELQLFCLKQVHEVKFDWLFLCWVHLSRLEEV